MGQTDYTLLPPVIKTTYWNYNRERERERVSRNQFNLIEHYKGISWVEIDV